MSKRTQQYEIKEAVRGSFVGAHGRIDYDLEAGTVSENDVDPEVLTRLIAAGHVGKPSKPVESEESA
jgi:hypothetical protein